MNGVHKGHPDPAKELLRRQLQNRAPMSAAEQMVEQRVAWLRVALAKERKIPEETQHGVLRLLRRERYALRRYTRQLTSPSRKDEDREVVYLDPSLAFTMMLKGLVESTEGRRPEHMFFLPNGTVMYLNQSRPEPVYNVPTVLTELGRSLLDALLKMSGD